MHFEILSVHFFQEWIQALYLLIFFCHPFDQTCNETGQAAKF